MIRSTSSWLCWLVSDAVLDYDDRAVANPLALQQVESSV